MTVSAERRLPIFDERKDEYDVELKQLTNYKVSIGSGEYGRATERLCSEELSLALSKVNNILSGINLRKPKQQTLISNYFSSQDK